MAFGCAALSATEETEYWKARALRAEEAMRGDEWSLKVEPFTLFETRCLRLLARHERVSLELFMTGLYAGYADDESDVRTIRTLISRARGKLPNSIVIRPIYRFGWMVEDRKALQAFLAEKSRPLSVNDADAVSRKPRAAEPALTN